jgi:hypothetical protein
MDFAAKQGDFLREASEWVRSGRREDIVEGLESAPSASIPSNTNANWLLSVKVRSLSSVSCR